MVAIAAYDFSQLPHLEEVLDAYSDTAAAGAIVHIVIHATVPYPLTLIDLLNTRYAPLMDQDSNDGGLAALSIEIQIVSPSLRLHLVDLHRALFYDALNDYDLFIYTEDDILVTPTTIHTYWTETTRLQQLVGKDAASDYNVGIVRYEYNYPHDVEINDKTRHATQNVTRVYWEHSYSAPNAVPDAVDFVGDSEAARRNNESANDNNKSKKKHHHRRKRSNRYDHPHVESLGREYVHMLNHHQGMFLATRDHLMAWKSKCGFDVPTDRPGRNGQPTQGTQRVWMSSQQLYGRNCSIQQVLPFQRFGGLTCWHLPNKNYRRKGHVHNRTFSDGTEVFDHGSDHLLTAMHLHLQLRRLFPTESSRTSSGDETDNKRRTYRGITMVDKIDRSHMPWGGELQVKYSRDDYLAMLQRRMDDFERYVADGGVLRPEDLQKTALVDIHPPE